MAEYSPPRLRTLMVTLAACGFSFGGAAGGFVAAAFMDGFGWQAVFLAGGVTPLLLFPFLLLFLPESLPRCSATHRPMPACASSASVWRRAGSRRRQRPTPSRRQA